MQIVDIIPPELTFIVIKKFFSKNGNIKAWIISLLLCILHSKNNFVSDMLLFTVYKFIYVQSTSTIQLALFIPLLAEQSLPLVCLHAVSFQIVSG